MQFKIYQNSGVLLLIACSRKIHHNFLQAFLINIFLIFGALNQSFAQNWVQRGSDLDGATLESIGLALSFSADGTVVAIGANANDLDPGNAKTSVKVRMWNGSAWIQKGSTLYAEQAGDNFGTSLSLSANGNVLAVGARTHSDVALYGDFSFSGRAYVYDWSGTDWVLRDNALIGGAAQENFGNDVSLSQDGNLLAVGAPGANAGGSLRGLARVYTWSGTSWSQVGSDLLGDTDFENFGTSLSLKVAGSETVLTIGSPTFTPSPGSDYVGRVKIFNRSGNSWNLSKTLNGDNTGDYFGYSVSLSNDGNRVAIGAPTDGIFSSQFIGYARTFDFTGSDWTQSGADIVSNIVFDEFGKKLALSGDGQYLIIGARGGTGNENGRAEVYTFNTNTWQQVGSDIIGEAQNDLSGEAVAINNDGTVIAIGAPANSGNGISSGHVRFFDPGCVAPAAPTGSASQVFCSGATIAQLAATGTNIQWYDASTGGALQNGTTSLINNTIYYASQTVGSCESTTRLAVTVTVNTTPTPTGNATQNFCSASTIADLVVTGTDIKWYDAASNGNLLTSSTVLVNNTSYFASQTISGCESSRLAVAVTVNTIAAPASLGPQLFCNSATVADLTADGTNLKWYDVATGGTPLSGSQALDTDVELVFYASQTVNGCESADRIAVAAGVYLITAPTGNASQEFCGSATIADLVATPMDAAEIIWYADATGGTALGSTTPLVNGTTYHAEQVFSSFCPSTSRLAVTVTLVICDQSITFGELPVKTFGDDPVTLEATSTSQLTITYTSSNTDVATIDGNQLIIVGAGTTTITASQAGNANYNAAEAVERSFTVNKASQSISGFDLPETYDLANGNTLTLSATAPSGQVTFSSSNTSVATVDGNTLNLAVLGSVTITALAAETNNYLQASATATIDVTDSRAILEIEEIDFGLLLRGETLSLAITVTNSGPGVATITNVTVPAGFTVTPTSFTLADDATRDISITFSPTIVRDYSGTLTLTTNASNNTKPITAECVYITELEQGADINTMAYPNPGNGVYTISNQYEKQVTIISSAGVAFQREAYEVAPRLMNLDLTDMPNGLYVLRLHGQGKTTTVKVIKK